MTAEARGLNVSLSLNLFSFFVYTSRESSEETACMHNSPEPSLLNNVITVKPVFSSHPKKTPKIGFQYRLLFNAGQSIAKVSKGSILQYFRPLISYHFPLRPFILSIFKWPLKTGVYCSIKISYIVLDHFVYFST